MFDPQENFRGGFIWPPPLSPPGSCGTVNSSFSHWRKKISVLAATRCADWRPPVVWDYFIISPRTRRGQWSVCPAVSLVTLYADPVISRGTHAAGSTPVKRGRSVPHHRGSFIYGDTDTDIPRPTCPYRTPFNTRLPRNTTTWCCYECWVCNGRMMGWWMIRVVMMTLARWDDRGEEIRHSRCFS